jgi:hypothetical protein
MYDDDVTTRANSPCGPGTEPRLSPFDAYLAAVVFLQIRNNRDPSVDIAATALAMAPHGGVPADPQMWDDWVAAVRRVLAAGGAPIPLRFDQGPGGGDPGRPPG